MITTIVIPVRGKSALTEQCLNGLHAELGDRGDVEVVVVDDGSLDDTRSLLDRIDWIRVLCHRDAKGFACSCNEGAAAGSGEYIIFLNNDTLGRSGWFENLVTYAADNPATGAVGAKLVYPNETIQHAGIVICSDLLPRHVYRGFAADHLAVSRSRSFQAVTAACVLVARAAFEEVGEFDEGYSNGFEDVDLCLRLRAAGYDVAYCAESTLVHFEAATRGEDSELFRRNAERYLARWGNVVHQDDISTYVEDGLVRVAASDVYPLDLRVDPLLASFDTEGTLADAFRLLGIRSRQVFDLLKENTRLSTGSSDFAR
jgi:GT2 family glycosyltransferase